VFFVVVVGWIVAIDRIPLAPMGVLAPRSAHAGPSAQPPIHTIFPEERSYIAKERGHNPRRERLYFCNEDSGHLRFCLQPRAAHALYSDQNVNDCIVWCELCQ
jgi:hypothetical protein